MIKKNHGFWEKYYFDSREFSKSYAKSWPENEDDYTKYLFELVIEDLNNICVYKNKK